MNTSIHRATIYGAGICLMLGLSSAAPAFSGVSYASSQASSYSGGIIWYPWFFPYYEETTYLPPSQVIPNEVTYNVQQSYGTYMLPLNLDQDKHTFARVLARDNVAIPYRTIKWQNEMEQKRLRQTR